MPAQIHRLPELRQDLELIEGPVSEDGGPTWLIHDPVRNLYFKLDWVSFEIFRHWEQVNQTQLLERINQAGRVQVTGQDVERMVEFLNANQLLTTSIGQSGRMAAIKRSMSGTWKSKLLHNYLFFRIPLIRPDRFLDNTQSSIQFFFSKLFAWLTLVVGLVGLLGVSRQWETFSHSLVDSFSAQGMLAYGITLGFVKILHELGHAYTAKRYGCHVPTMGFAFLVLWPVLYTDTNDVWRLKSNRQRLNVSSAGVLTELVVACWATFLWIFTPEGMLRNMLFLLASTTWISSVLINLSPFMRFDGYFILMDWLKFPNLHPRSFALARWQLRNFVLGLNDPPPEDFSQSRQRALICFAWATWIYRLTLFLGIAALVYSFFVKLVGIFLFFVEMIWFVAKPIWNEIEAWKQRATEVEMRRKLFLKIYTAGIFLILFVIPMPSRLVASAVLIPTEHFKVYSPKGAMMETLNRSSSALKKDDLIFSFNQSQLASQEKVNQAKKEAALWQSSVATMNTETQGLWGSLTAQSNVASAEGTVIASDLSKYKVHAPFSGTVHMTDPDVQSGQWLKDSEDLAQIVGSNGIHIVTYLKDSEINRVEVGSSAFFVPDSGSGPKFSLQVSQINSDRVRTLTEPELASNFGGSVLVREQKGQFFPEGAYYRVSLTPTSNSITSTVYDFKWRGHVYVQQNYEPLLWPLLRASVSVLIREFGF